MSLYQIERNLIDEFKQSWPCHGLPDEFDRLTVETDVRGDIVDIVAEEQLSDGSFEVLDWHEFDGPSLLALVDDCKTLGTDPGAASVRAGLSF